MLERAMSAIANAEREAGPDRRTEIKRHPGNLILPLSDVVCHDPTKGRVTETLQRAQRSAAVCNFGPPSRQIHWDVDGRQKREIACDADDRDDEGHANHTVKLRQQPAKANRDDEESQRPY